MKKKCVSVVLFLVGIFSGCSASPNVKRIFDASVIVKGNMTVGTGVVIKTNKIGGLEETYILTARHVVLREIKAILATQAQQDFAFTLISKEPWFYDVDYNPQTGTIILIKKIPLDFVKVSVNVIENEEIVQKDLDASVIFVSKKKDLALIRLISKQTLSEAINVQDKTKCQAGDDLWSCGFTVSELTLTKGILGRELKENGSRMGLFTGGIIVGESGGGVFDKNGDLIGIVVNVKGTRSTGPIWHLAGFEFVDKKTIEEMMK